MANVRSIAKNVFLSVPFLLFAGVTAADALKYPLIVGARAIVVAHNHPSGNHEPSSDDIALTTRLRSASKLLGIDLLDHIVVGADGYTSFLDAGLMHG